MAKKKTNGFHLFANSRRSVYEMQSGGRRLSQKMVIEMASNEWSSLTKTEQAAWLSRPKVQPAAKVTPNPFISQGRSGNGGGGSNTRGGGGGTGSHGNGPQAQVKKSHVVEQELVKRTYKTGLDRATAREEFYGNLLWREKDRLDDILNRRWGLVVLSAEGETVANEIICLCMENSKIVSEMRIHRSQANIQPGEKLHSLDCLWNIGKAEDINTACIRMNRFLQCCCYNYILVPAHQQHEVSAILHQMKQTRDDLHNRDTQSIRLDRLICIEDAVHMLRKLRNLPLVNNEVDQKWEQLTGEWEQMSPLKHARAVADYFLGSLEPETAYFDEEEEREFQRQQQMAEERAQRQRQQQEEREKAARQLQEARMEEQRLLEKQREEKEAAAAAADANWVTVSPEGCRFARPDLQAHPRFLMGHLMQPPSMPLLTPPDHISPRFRRHPLPRRWRHPLDAPYNPSLQDPSLSFLHTHHSQQESPSSPPPFFTPAVLHTPPPPPRQQPQPHHQCSHSSLQPPQLHVHRCPPPGLAPHPAPAAPAPDPADEWNPFARPPEIVQNSKDKLFQSVSRWLENISLDPAPVGDDEDEEEEEEDGLHVAAEIS